MKPFSLLSSMQLKESRKRSPESSQRSKDVPD